MHECRDSSLINQQSTFKNPLPPIPKTNSVSQITQPIGRSLIFYYTWIAISESSASHKMVLSSCVSLEKISISISQKCWCFTFYDEARVMNEGIETRNTTKFPNNTLNEISRLRPNKSSEQDRFLTEDVHQ